MRRRTSVPQLTIVALIIASMSCALAGCGRGDPVPGDGSSGVPTAEAAGAPKDPATDASADASRSGQPDSARDASSSEGAGSTSKGTGGGAGSSTGAQTVPLPLGGINAVGSGAPAPGTLSLRFIARIKETKAEIPAGSFEVRLLSLDAVRGGGTGSQDRPDPKPGAGSAASGPAEGTYAGPPQQVLVTQPDGSKWTFVAGVRPGLYALRITAKGRRMLLEALTVKAEDKLVERTLERE